jgi:hypothetical protein
MRAFRRSKRHSQCIRISSPSYRQQQHSSRSRGPRKVCLHGVFERFRPWLSAGPTKIVLALLTRISTSPNSSRTFSLADCIPRGVSKARRSRCGHELERQESLSDRPLIQSLRDSSLVTTSSAKFVKLEPSPILKWVPVRHR